MKRGLEPAGPQPTAIHPWRCQQTHLRQQHPHVQIRRTQHLQWPCGPTTFRQRRGFEHHRARIAARHPEIGCVGTRVDPRPPAERPSISRCAVWLPTLHRHDAAVDVKMESPHEPLRKLTECQAVTHGHRAGADKAFAACLERQPLHGPAHRVRTIQNPHGLVLLRSRLEHVTQRGDERVDSAPDVLQINEQNVEAIHHFGGRPAYFTVKAEDRDAVHGVGVVLRLDHVVLLVAAQPMLRAERRAQTYVAERRQRIEGMDEVACYGSGVRQQSHAPSRQRLAHLGLFEQSVDSKPHERATSNAKPFGWWKSGLPGGCRSPQYESLPSSSSMTAARAIRR